MISFIMEIQKITSCLARTVETDLPSLKGKTEKAKQESALEESSNKEGALAWASHSPLMLWAAPDITRHLLLDSEACDLFSYVPS